MHNAVWDPVRKHTIAKTAQVYNLQLLLLPHSSWSSTVTTCTTCTWATRGRGPPSTTLGTGTVARRSGTCSCGWLLRRYAWPRDNHR